MPRLSVIIPTFRRAEILGWCLRHLEQQTIAGDIEVIVVSDGHDEATAALFRDSAWRIPVHFFEVPKSQQGVARNEGVKHATAERVLFIGDDTFLEPGACEKHAQSQERIANSGQRIAVSLTAHRSPLTAILGFTTWDPAVGITPVMRWLEKSGWQFGYPSLARYAHDVVPPHMQHRYTYTSHISVPLVVAKAHPFRAELTLYGWEDIEWGMRLHDAGVQLFYEPDAKALHHHHVTLEDSLKRMETLGRAAVEIIKKVPSFDRVPHGWKLLAYHVLALLPTMAGRHRKAFLWGVSEINDTSTQEFVFPN